MIKIIDEYGGGITAIKKVKNNLWEFFLTWDDSYDTDWELLNDYDLEVKVYLDKTWIQSLIKSLKQIMIEKPDWIDNWEEQEEKEYPIIWKENPAEIKLVAVYDWPVKNLYHLWFCARNNTLTNYAFWQYEMELEEEWQDPYNDWFSWPWITLPEENIQKYINQLEEEIWEPLTDWKEFKKTNCWLLNKVKRIFK